MGEGKDLVWRGALGSVTFEIQFILLIKGVTFPVPTLRIPGISASVYTPFSMPMG